MRVERSRKAMQVYHGGLVLEHRGLWEDVSHLNKFLTSNKHIESNDKLEEEHLRVEDALHQPVSNEAVSPTNQ